MFMGSVIVTLALNAGVFAAPANPTQAPAQQTASQQQALSDLSQQEQDETDKIRYQMREQMRAVRHKFQQRRYELMEQNHPGSAKLLKQMDDFREKNEDDMVALSDKKRAELKALPKPVKPMDRKAVEDKYKTQTDALRTEFQSQMQALIPAPPTPPAAQPAAAPTPHK
jgi:Spy/CpxP family protein refolding chaperone